MEELLAIPPLCKHILTCLGFQQPVVPDTLNVTFGQTRDQWEFPRVFILFGRVFGQAATQDGRVLPQQVKAGEDQEDKRYQKAV